MTSLLTVRVTARAGRDAIDGWSDDGVLHVRVRAAASDGKANEAVRRLLARELGVPLSRVSIAGGAASRLKRIRLHGVDTAITIERLPPRR